MNEHIEEAIQTFRTSSARYAKTERYYSGDHDLSFATDKFQTAFGALFREFALNLCPAICDSVGDKLRITGFSINRNADFQSALSAKHEQRVGSEHHNLQTAITRIWHANRMALRAGEIHTEAIKNGDAYAIVWPGTDGRPMIYAQRAAQCVAVYDDEIPGRIRWGAKYWRTRDRRTRLNLLYPDRIEKYISQSQTEGYLPVAGNFVPIGPQANVGTRTPSSAMSAKHELPAETVPIVRNPYGVVPLFHFANNAEIGAFGKSELLHAIPIQNGLNKAVLDMLVAMEFSAYRQRWVAGIEVENDPLTGKLVEPFRAGVDHLWIAADANARFGDFGTTDLDQFLKVKDSFRVDMASVSGTPLHYFLQNTQGFASGESLRKSEVRFLAKVRDRQQAFGQVWTDLMSFALKIAGFDSVELLTNWEDPAPIAEREFLENILLKKQIGITPGQALKEAGYGDEDVRQMLGTTGGNTTNRSVPHSNRRKHDR